METTIICGLYGMFNKLCPDANNVTMAMLFLEL